MFLSLLVILLDFILYFAQLQYLLFIDFILRKNIIYLLLVLNLRNTGTFVVVVIVLPSSGSALQHTASPHVASIQGKFFGIYFPFRFTKTS